MRWAHNGRSGRESTSFESSDRLWRPYPRTSRANGQIPGGRPRQHWQCGGSRIAQQQDTSAIVCRTRLSSRREFVKRSGKQAASVRVSVGTAAEPDTFALATSKLLSNAEGEADGRQ